MANPPFNDDYWGASQVADDARWTYGVPPDSNANFAWIQHFIHHLAPKGRAGFVMSPGSLSTKTNGEDKIREGIIDDDLIDCIVACPPKLFYTTQSAVCLWFLDNDKGNGSGRDRRKEILFIDARKLGRKISRTQIEFTDEEIKRVAATYHAWRGEEGAGTYEDQPGFCATATVADLEANGYVLNPGRYIDEDEMGAAVEAGDLAELSELLSEQFAESARLSQVIEERLSTIAESQQ